MTLQSTIWTTWLNLLPGMVFDEPTLIPVSVYVLGKTNSTLTWEEKFSVFWRLLVSAITYMQCFLSRFVQALSTAFVTLFGGFCFSWFLSYATVDEALGCFLSLHFSADSPWLERQELSEITFLNLFWHADQSLITHLLCVILPVYLSLKTKLSPTPVSVSS